MLQLHRPATSHAPTSGVGRYLWWRAGQQKGLVVAGVALGVVHAMTQAGAPYVLGRAVDDGLEQGISPALLTWAGALLGLWVLRALTGVIAHRVDVANWLRACLGTIHLMGATVAATGENVRRTLPTGEVVATVASDSPRIGEIYAFAGRFFGGLIAYVAVAIILLHASAPLGLAVLLGIPLVAGILAIIVRPLQRRQAEHREQNGRLTTLGADTVSGLRILRGIGGEEAFTARYRAQSQRVREAGVRVAGTQSLLDMMQTLLPGLFLAGVIWYGARLAIAGDIAPGELVAFYGYAAFLTAPLNDATQGVQIFTRARIAARRVLDVLRVPPAVTDVGATSTLPTGPAVLEDPSSGLRVEPGTFVALVAADPDETAALATRLGRFDDAGGAASPLLGGVALADVPLSEVRRRVVVSEATPSIFTGVLADELDVRERGDSGAVAHAMTVADAGDVITSVPGGLGGTVAEKGRSLSGGQRQRVALARALMTDAEVLVLIEPTSAVDAHTEARIASRLRPAREGRTTVVVSASPLVLDQVDEVVLVEDGRVAARGSHHELMHDAELAVRGEVTGARAEAAVAYRRVVSRSVDDDAPAETPGETDLTDTTDLTEQTLTGGAR
ncbi:ABC transporter ATP-binding protein [Litorihabitans aurantiacus]|uniref:Multidrug ABC transporter permease n=1 Tax=Litorihabitans aurantiacus TaxID=1930061 RepID=A0AA37XFC1_9MICO|nr:ABC transporter ATP-binding protein [Litorihabitans aurantiacus]GMA32221.1 multidrug ABC transporter permease [Litorihabitans aurantiacus]